MADGLVPASSGGRRRRTGSRRGTEGETISPLALPLCKWVIVLLFAGCFAGVAWYVVGGVKIKAGWQNGQSPLARYLDGKRRAKFNLQLPEALATMSNALRAGFSISQAFDSVVEQGERPMSEEFAILQQQLKIGMSFEDALESLGQRVGSDDLMLVTTAILISRKTGGNVTEIFDKISETIRGRMKVERKVKTLFVGWLMIRKIIKIDV